MAYPYEITQTDFLIYPHGHKPIRRSNGDLYAVLEDQASPATIHVYRSTDAGLTWTLQDSINSPSTLATTNYHYNVYDDSPRIWVVFSPGGTTPPTESYVRSFNTTTNLWETAITGGPASIRTPAPSTSLTNDAKLGLGVRSNGDKVVVYTESVPFGGSNYTALRVKVYNGTSWSSSIDLLIPGTTETTYVNYTFMGMVRGASDRFHVFAATLSGHVYITINSDNSVTNYRRFDQDPIDTGGHRDGHWGLPQIVTFGGQDYAALPHGIVTTVNGVSNTYYPGILLVPDQASPPFFQYLYVNETVKRESGANWISIAIAFDTSTGSLYLLWTKVDPADLSTEVRVACTKGFAWSTPSTLFTSPADDLIESMEVQASSGVLRAFFENSTGDGFYLFPHYYESAVTCAQTGCPTVGSAGNYAFLGEG